LKKSSNQKLKNQILSCNRLNYSIGYKKILKNISFQIFQNEITLLRGENGSGKSTLLKLIFQNKYHKDKIQSDDNLKIGYLSHELGLYSSLSLKENLRYFSKIGRGDSTKLDLNEYIELFHLKNRIHDPVYSYSKGMKQKAGILCALASSPNLLLLDEPTSGLDENSCKVFYTFIERFQNYGSILWVTHDASLEKKFKSKTLLLVNGELIN